MKIRTIRDKSRHRGGPTRNKDIAEHGKATRFQKGHKLSKGRRPMAIELNAREFILRCANGDAGVEKLVKKMYQQALAGAFKQQELLLNYIVGRPTERIKLEAVNGSSTLNIGAPVIKIIADTLRLERLKKDEEGPRPIEASRIEEMEDILTDAVKTGYNGEATRDNTKQLTDGKTNTSNKSVRNKRR